MKAIYVHPELYALVDDNDLELVSKHRWYLHRSSPTTQYASTSNSIYMHRLIMNASKGQIIDHINRNGLDNRRCNLRFVTASQNGINRRTTVGTSKFKGVSWSKHECKWCVSIKVRKRKISLGYYHDEIAAAKAYDLGAKEHFGEIASLNFPDEPDSPAPPTPCEITRPPLVRFDNKSGFRGVYLHKQTGKWRATRVVNGKTIDLGLFPTAEAANAAMVKRMAELAAG